MANEALTQVGIKNYEINIGHLGIIKGVLNQLNISSQQQTAIIASIDKEDYELLDKLLEDNDISSEYKNIITSIINIKGSRSDLETLKQLLEDIPESFEALENLDKTLEVLEVFGFDDYVVNLSIARGLDYYTGIVFEIYVPDLGAEKQITGGGTYNLTALFDSEKVESTGFAFGFDRIMEAYHRQNIQVPISSKPKVLVIPVKKEFKLNAIEVAQQLRAHNIVTDIDLKGKKLKKNLSYANNHNFNKVIMIGQQEVEDETVTIKDMDSGCQETIPQNTVVSELLK